MLSGKYKIVKNPKMAGLTSRQSKLDTMQCPVPSKQAAIRAKERVQNSVAKMARIRKLAAEYEACRKLHIKNGDYHD